jgi:ribosomal protein S18 acetylase RimI-like enzyme
VAVTVRRVRPDDTARFRAVRLAALHDSPSAFGSTYAAEIELAEDAWTDRVVRASAGDDRAHLLAEDGDDVVGLVGVFRRDDGVTADLVSMWTSPRVRRRGVGRQLVEAATAWARGAGVTTLELWVTTGNEPAQSLYESLGFEVTGDHQPLPSDPCRDETRMVLRLVR